MLNDERIPNLPSKFKSNNVWPLLAENCANLLNFTYNQFTNLSFILPIFDSFGAKRDKMLFHLNFDAIFGILSSFSISYFSSFYIFFTNIFFTYFSGLSVCISQGLQDDPEIGLRLHTHSPELACATLRYGLRYAALVFFWQKLCRRNTIRYVMLRYRITDFYNKRDWLFIVLTTTACAINQ